MFAYGYTAYIVTAVSLHRIRVLRHAVPDSKKHTHICVYIYNTCIMMHAIVVSIACERLMMFCCL